MPTEKNPSTEPVTRKFTSLSAEDTVELNFQVRDINNKKVDVTELFTQFTANIIREDKLFTR